MTAPRTSRQRERIRNCGNCPHLVGVVSQGLPMYGCGKTRRKPVVPQETDRSFKHPGSTVTTFARVPSWCPLPDDRVERSDQP